MPAAAQIGPQIASHFAKRAPAVLLNHVDHSTAAVAFDGTPDEVTIGGEPDEDAIARRVIHAGGAARGAFCVDCELELGRDDPKINPLHLVQLIITRSHASVYHTNTDRLKQVAGLWGSGFHGEAQILPICQFTAIASGRIISAGLGVVLGQTAAVQSPAVQMNDSVSQVCHRWHSGTGSEG